MLVGAKDHLFLHVHTVANLEAMLAILGLCCPNFGAMLGHLGAMLGSMLGHFAAMSAYLGVMLTSLGFLTL